MARKVKKTNREEHPLTIIEQDLKIRIGFNHDHEDDRHFNVWVDEFPFDELPYCSPSRLDDDIKDEMKGTVRINDELICEEEDGAFDWYYETFLDKLKK